MNRLPFFVQSVSKNGAFQNKVGTRFRFELFIGLGLILGSGMSLAVQAGPAHLMPLNIFGADNRIVLAQPKPEFAAVGKLTTGTSYCTATQIGPNLVLTAAHCLFNQTTHQQYALPLLHFVPRFGLPNQGQARKVVAVELGGVDVQQNRAWDWALLTLEALPMNGEHSTPVGPEAILRVRMISPRQMVSMGPVFTVVGYSGDVAGGGRPSAHFGCSARGWHHAVLEHDCDIAPGASGGPMLTGFDAQGRLTGAPVEIVAINVAQRYRVGVGFFRTRREPTPVGVDYASDLSNLAVHAWNFGESLNRLLNLQRP